MSNGWKRALARQVGIKGGKTLKTLADVRAYLLAMPAAEAGHFVTQETARLLMQASEDGKVDDVTLQLERVLAHEGRLRLT